MKEGKYSALLEDAPDSSSRKTEKSGNGTPLGIGFVIAIIVAVAGSTAESVAVVNWNTIPLNLLGVIVFEDIVFCVCFVCGMVCWAAVSGNWTFLWPAADPTERALFTLRARPTLHQLVVLIGFLNTLWGILGVYAEPGYRTPPLIQGILMNCCVLFVAPLSKLLLGDRKRYCSAQPLFAAGLMTAAVLVSITPLIQSQGPMSSSASTFGWITIFVVSLIPGALEGVLEQMYLIRSNALRPDATPIQYWLPILRLLMWTSMWQLFFLLSLFFVDFLPWFGTSSGVADFASQLSATLACSAFGVAPATGTIAVGCGTVATLSAWGASFGFVVSYIGGAFLNRDSATFAFLTSVLVTCLSSALFLLPGVNPYPAYTPLWSVLVSLALSVAGLCVWKRWELSVSDSVAEQYALRGDDDVDDDGDSVVESMVLGSDSSLSLEQVSPIA